MNGVKVNLSSRWMTLEAGRQCAKDRKESRALVNMQIIEFHSEISGWFCVLSDRPPSPWW